MAYRKGKWLLVLMSIKIAYDLLTCVEWVKNLEKITKFCLKLMVLLNRIYLLTWEVNRFVYIA